MSETNTADRTLTVFMLVKTTPEWLGIPVEERIKIARHTLQPLFDEFHNRLRLKWYDVEFYTARITDVWMIEAEDHQSYQLFCEKLRETPFWDRYFRVEEILPGEENAWAKNYEIDPLRS
ncbi:MAG: darcynin family protein [Nostoc sp.]|uniref:darcynin family protein n=1 Tax=Nostoc sp. TaxID=1180 RepID=UPI002FFC4741